MVRPSDIFQRGKVQIFLKGSKILKNLLSCLTLLGSAKKFERFKKKLWPSQNSCALMWAKLNVDFDCVK